MLWLLGFMAIQFSRTRPIGQKGLTPWHTVAGSGVIESDERNDGPEVGKASGSEKTELVSDQVRGKGELPV